MHFPPLKISRYLDTLCFHICGLALSDGATFPMSTSHLMFFGETKLHTKSDCNKIVLELYVAKPCRKSTILSYKQIHRYTEMQWITFKTIHKAFPLFNLQHSRDEDEANGRTDSLPVTPGSSMPFLSLDTRKRSASVKSTSLLSTGNIFQKIFMYLCSAWNITSSLASGAQENTWRSHPRAYLATQQQVGILPGCVCVSWDVWNLGISTFSGTLAFHHVWA